jgi:hypothetical protein
MSKISHLCQFDQAGRCAKRAWEASVVAALEQPPPPRWRDPGPHFRHQFYVLIACRDERHQRELLDRFHSEGLDCQAKLC